MADLPRLAWVSVIDDPEDEKFMAELSKADSDHVQVDMELPDARAIGLAQGVLVANNVASESSREREPDGSYHYHVRFALDFTGYGAAIGFITDTFGRSYRNLTASYWYAVEGNGGVPANLSALISAAPERPRFVTFQLPSDDTRNTSEVWEQFTRRLDHEGGGLPWEELVRHPDAVEVGLTKDGWANLEPTLLALVQLFSLQTGTATC